MFFIMFKVPICRTMDNKRFSISPVLDNSSSDDFNHESRKLAREQY